MRGWKKIGSIVANGLGWAFAAAMLLLDRTNYPEELKIWGDRFKAAQESEAAIVAASTLSAALDLLSGLHVRVGLALAVVVLMLWGSRPFWRARHRLTFAVRKAMSTEVWVGRDAAVQVVRESRWARVRRKLGEKPKSFFESATNLGMVSDPERDAASMLFQSWCRMALDNFAADHEDAVRQIEQVTTYDEVALKNWLEGRYAGDVVEKFGTPY